MSENHLVPKIDLIKASYSHLLAISFNKSTSPSYPIVINMAQRAFIYEEMILNGKLIHLVIFARTKEDASRARTLLQYISGWQGIQIFAGGQTSQSSWQVLEILSCYLKANTCTDWTAHCHLVIDDPSAQIPRERGISLTISLARADSKKPDLKEGIPVGRYIFPCAFLHSRFNFQIDHPAKFQDQIQAGAVSAGCNWCPFFDPSKYRQIGTRMIYKNLF